MLKTVRRPTRALGPAESSCRDLSDLSTTRLLAQIWSRASFHLNKRHWCRTVGSTTCLWQVPCSIRKKPDVFSVGVRRHATHGRKQREDRRNRWCTGPDGVDGVWWWLRWCSKEDKRLRQWSPPRSRVVMLAQHMYGTNETPTLSVYWSSSHTCVHKFFAIPCSRNNHRLYKRCE